MIPLLFTLCLVNVLGVAALAFFIGTAPDGFEDSEGFHAGDRPFDAAAQRELAFALSRV